MRKMTRMILISAVLATSGLTAKVANENYRAVVTNDERIHKAYENAKQLNKAAVLEAIVEATNAESDERIRDAVVLEPEEAKTPRVVRVTTSAGVSPIVPTMDKRTVNKAEEFIEKIVHPAAIVMKKNLDFATENIPIQELVYETKDIFPTFEETVVVLPNTYDYPYRMTWPEGSFGNTMTKFYKTYYNAEYNDQKIEVWYDEVYKRWNSDNFPIDELDGKLYIMDEQITLGTPTRRVPVRGNDGVFSYNYNEASKAWNRRALYLVVKPNTFDFSDITEDKATWRILEWDGEYNLYSFNYTHSIFTNEGLKCYRLENKTFKYQFNYNYHQRQYLEGNKNCGLWTTETGSVDYNYLFLEKAKTNEWKILADYGDDYSIDR